jgi:ATP-dependent Clp protease ATP-binding subunit ClpA
LFEVSGEASMFENLLEQDCLQTLHRAGAATPKAQGYLDVITLMSALYHDGHLRRRWPRLAALLPPLPLLIRDLSGAQMEMAQPLTDLFAVLQASPGVSGGRLLSREALFDAIISSGVGYHALHLLGGEQALPWKSSPRRENFRRQCRDERLGQVMTDACIPPRIMVGVEDELKEIANGLCQPKYRNAMLVGPSGAGKTAIVRELARRIATHDELIDAQLWECDILRLERPTAISAVLELLAGLPDVILYVEGIQELLKRSPHGHDPFGDAKESFRQKLQDFRVIGCMTDSSFAAIKEVEKTRNDNDLMRRLRIIRVAPPTSAVTVEILRARRPSLVDHFGVGIDDGAIVRAVELSDPVPNRRQPEKSLRLLEGACGLCAQANPRREIVHAEDVGIEFRRNWSGEDEEPMERRLTPEGVLAELRAQVFGQDPAMDAIARRFVAALEPPLLARPDGPRATLFFAGPTAVGKTETARILAAILARKCGVGEPALIRVGCNTLQERGDAGPIINQLLGSPPGYLGHVSGGGGILAGIRTKPDCVLLFDEVEKAGAGLFNLLLNIIDKGVEEDRAGNLLDFRRAVLIFTSNAGATYTAQRPPLGFAADGKTTADGRMASASLASVLDSLRKHGVQEEFLGRISSMGFVVFDGLEPGAGRAILANKWQELQTQLAARRITVYREGDVDEWLLSRWHLAYGARDLLSLFRRHVEDAIINANAERPLSADASVVIRVAEAAACREDRADSHGDATIIDLAD